MKRILIIDDAATVRLYHRNILETAGYGVDEAINGIEALEKALRTPYDLYIVDINMPKLDGYGFLKELRSADLPQAPAVMVSTEAAAHDEKRALASGANLYLVKPVKPDELLSHARLLLGEPRP
jgi:two-component system chemotaxis response regulator CheY